MTVERRMAGARMRDLFMAMTADGDTPITLLTGGIRRPVPHHHYPEGDVYDFASHAQFYYHVHRHGEFGHVHLFQRPRGMPVGIRPLVPTDQPDAPCHLVAVGFGPDGDAAELFTTNRWVTGEAWYAAAEVKTMLRRFRLATRGRLAPVAQWLEAVVEFYRPQIEILLDQRDAAIAEWDCRHPGRDVLDDGELEITSRLAVAPAADVAERP